MVLPVNESEYFVELIEEDEEPERLRVYLVEVGGQKLLNINEVEASSAPPSYNFARYELAESRQLWLTFIGEEGVPEALASDTLGLVDYVKSHLNDPALDDRDGPMVFRRPGPGEVEGGRLRREARPTPRAAGRRRK